MSDKSETCGMCEGQGVTGIAGYLCDRCNGTGISTTGEVVGALPSTPDPVTDEPLPSQVPTITVTHNGAATPPFPDRYFRVEPWTPAGAIERANTTIAEQAAEIERLTKERDTHLCPLCHGTGMVGNVNDREACERCEGTGIDAYTEMIAELTTNRDALRLEVLRLNDLKCEAMDRYAALEAERDALKRAIDAAMRTIAAQSSTLFEDWP